MNITVGSAPNGSIIERFSSYKHSLWYRRLRSRSPSQMLASAGNLALSTELIDTNYIFKADFEDGTLETFTSASANGSLSNTSTVTNSGNGALMMNGYFNTSATTQCEFFQCAAFSSILCNEGKCWTRGEWLYLVFRGSIFNSWVFTLRLFLLVYDSQLRLVYRSSNGYTTTHYVYTTANEFVNIEYDNIDWTNKTFDIIIDGVTIATGAQFYYNLNTGINGIHSYQYSTSYVHYLDDVEVQGGNALSITQNPTSATVAGGNNVVMNFTVDATGLYAGSYFLELALTSNDTALDGMKIPVIVNVTGDGVWASNYSSCLNISGYSGAVTRDTLEVMEFRL